MTDEALPVPSPTPLEFCRVCGSAIPQRGQFCQNCGAPTPSTMMMFAQQQYYQPQKPKASWRDLVKQGLAISTLTLAAQLVLATVILIYAVGMVGEDILDDSDSLSEVPLYLLLHEIIVFTTISGNGLLAYYLLLVAATTASVAWVFAAGGKEYFKEIMGKSEHGKHSPMFEIAGLMFAVLLLNFVIVLLAGVSEDDVPSGGTLEENLFYLANASLWEEIAVRVLLVGIPLLFIDLLWRRPGKKWYSYLLGGGFRFGIPETLLVILSSALFGYAHFLGGWGEWKVPAAGIAGVAFGYLFLKHGIAAAITLHFGFNYLTMPWEVLDSFALEALTSLAALLWMGLGGVFLVYYIIRMIEFLTGESYLDRKPQPVGMPAVDPRFIAYGQPGQFQPQAHYPQSQQVTYQQEVSYRPLPQAGFGGYVCPRCGSIEARWDGTRFQCLRCGQLS